MNIRSYFGDVNKLCKIAFYALLATLLGVYSLIGIIAPLLRPPCTQEAGATPGDQRGTDQRVEGIELGGKSCPSQMWPSHGRHPPMVPQPASQQLHA